MGGCRCGGVQFGGTRLMINVIFYNFGEKVIQRYDLKSVRRNMRRQK